MAGSEMMMMMMMMMVVGASMCLSMLAVGGFAMVPQQPLMVDGGGQEPLDEVVTEVKQAGDGCVVIYEHKDGTGKNEEFCLDGESEYRVNNFKTFGMNDMASAVDVGDNAQVLLYADANLKGDMIRLKPGWHTIQDSWKDNVASSLLVKKS